MITHRATKALILTSTMLLAACGGETGSPFAAVGSGGTAGAGGAGGGSTTSTASGGGTGGMGTGGMGTGGTGPGGAPACQSSFSDTFDYEIDEVQDLIDHGWSWAKADNLTGSHRGTITSDAGSLRFDLEGEDGQTDVYTEIDQIAGDVTFEFDLFVDEDAGGIQNRFKFLYPSVDGNYPQPVDTIRWLMVLSPANISPEIVEGNGRELFFRFESYNYAQATDPRIAVENRWKLGQNLSLTPITLGAWHHVRIHIDTSGEHGAFEAWLDGEKVAEWIDGVTPDFSFSVPPEARGGHEGLRVITTADDDMTLMFDNFALCE
jgi:hypothetical protein